MVLQCAACKMMRRKCSEECIFAPYFPQSNPQRFAYVYKDFGANNVAKMLNEVSVSQREDVVKSLAYEAEARFKDPVYGCVDYISLLQQRLIDLESEIINAKKELSSNIGPQVFQPSYTPTFHQQPHNLEGLSGSSSSNHVSPPLNHIQMNPFHNIVLSFSPSPSQQQPHHSYFSTMKAKTLGRVLPSTDITPYD